MILTTFELIKKKPRKTLKQALRVTTGVNATQIADERRDKKIQTRLSDGRSCTAIYVSSQHARWFADYARHIEHLTPVRSRCSAD